MNPSSRKPRIRGRNPAWVISRAGSTDAPGAAVGVTAGGGGGGGGVTVCGPGGGGGTGATPTGTSEKINRLIDAPRASVT